MDEWKSYFLNFRKCGAHGGIILTGGNWRTRRKIYPSATLSTTNFSGLTWARTRAAAVLNTIRLVVSSHLCLYFQSGVLFRLSSQNFGRISYFDQITCWFMVCHLHVVKLLVMYVILSISLLHLLSWTQKFSVVICSSDLLQCETNFASIRKEVLGPVHMFQVRFEWFSAFVSLDISLLLVTMSCCKAKSHKFCCSHN
jgi:hypothetical protein